jgi:KUP system potassium uptake protein
MTCKAERTIEQLATFAMTTGLNPFLMKKSQSSLTTLCIGAIGVVYGDIGTSPLYAFKEVFASGHVPVTPGNVLGILSVFFWTLTIIVSVKYVVLMMRADNHNEGGLMALLALASQSVKHKPQIRQVLMVCGVFGVALFFGDGVITPAISVLAAVEGLEIITPAAKPYVLPISFAVLIAQFVVQKRGTGTDNQTRADLLEIIDDRAANKATIITSQLPIDHWHA